MNLEDIYAQFPRSKKYDLQWMVEDQMGPNVVWLAEALTQVMELKPGMPADAEILTGTGDR